VSTETATESGWYPDPWGQAEKRYWDGNEWTGHTHGGESEAPPATESIVPAQAPTPETTGTQEVSLSEAQVAFLTSQLTLGALVKRALGWAATVPVALAALGYTLVRLVAWVPLFGWVFALWGIIGTIAAVIAGIIVTPLVALVLLPIVMLVTRPKLRQDLGSGRAVRQTGRFVIEPQKVGAAQLRTGTGKSFDLTSAQLKTLEDVLPAVGEVRVLNGALMKTTHTSVLLGLYDESGRELLSAD
jgi:hypothetical protein